MNKKKYGGGKEKGSQFERIVSGYLDKWWGVLPKTFWRTVASGGWEEPGDIAPRLLPMQGNVDFPIVVECKFYRKIDVFEIVKNPKNDPILVQWWNQVTASQMKAEKLGRVNLIRLLIFKQNGGPILVGFSFDDGNYHYRNKVRDLSVEHIEIFWKNQDFRNCLFCIMPFSVYIKHITKEIILKGNHS